MLKANPSEKPNFTEEEKKRLRNNRTKKRNIYCMKGKLLKRVMTEFDNPAYFAAKMYFK